LCLELAYASLYVAANPPTEHLMVLYYFIEECAAIRLHVLQDSAYGSLYPRI